MNKPILFIAVGPSGSGKSTIYEKLKSKIPRLAHYSWDKLRHEWYDPTNYSKAWELANKDPKFGEKVATYFNDLIRNKQSVYVDNTNLTKKRRKMYIAAAKRAGYKIVGITFNVDLQTLIDRQSTRGDKNVPASSVTQQFKSLVAPSMDEGFDEIVDSKDI